MATYVPNALDIAEPTASRTVESAALEFRTVKVELVKIAAVAGALDDIAVVADDLNLGVASTIRIVAADIADVTSAATNMAAIIAAPVEASAAAASAIAAAASYDSFDDRYLGAKAVAPTLDNDGAALLTGALYWDTATNLMYVWGGGTWHDFSPTLLTVAKTSATGSAVLPIGTTAEQDVSPVKGYLRYNSTTDSFEGYAGTTPAWGAIGGGGGATGGGTDDIFYENGQTVTTDYTITAGKNAMSAGPITILDGVTVTIPDGCAWVING